MTKPAKVTYQCIDDDRNVETLCQSISDAAGTEQLVITRRYPKPWEEEVALIVGKASSGEMTGCLLDYRLDDQAEVKTLQAIENSAPPIPVSYTADSLVQELRRRSVENGEDSFPIVLWSNATRLDQFHEIDPNFKLHYDLILDKEKIGHAPVQEASQLVALALGYDAIRKAGGKTASVADFLAAPFPEAASSLDAFYKNQYPLKGFAYQVALFVIHEILDSEGPLISESMVNALLGVQVDALSSKKAQTELHKFRYKGIFASGFSRYWKVPLLQFLDLLAEDGSWLKRDASERAHLLSRHFKLKSLKPIEPISPKYSTVYDTVCSKTERPLNRMNGFALFDDCPRVWKEKKFISADALRKVYGIRGSGVRLDDGERRRYLAMYDAK